MLEEKIGADRDPYYVLGACNPNMADRALDASNNRIGDSFRATSLFGRTNPAVRPSTTLAS
jgi:hypothetical protein